MVIRQPRMPPAVTVWQVEGREDILTPLAFHVDFPTSTFWLYFCLDGANLVAPNRRGNLNRLSGVSKERIEGVGTASAIEVYVNATAYLHPTRHWFRKDRVELEVSMFEQELPVYATCTSAPIAVSVAPIADTLHLWSSVHPWGRNLLGKEDHVINLSEGMEVFDVDQRDGHWELLTIVTTTFGEVLVEGQNATTSLHLTGLPGDLQHVQNTMVYRPRADANWENSEPDDLCIRLSDTKNQTRVFIGCWSVLLEPVNDRPQVSWSDELQLDLAPKVALPPLTIVNDGVVILTLWAESGTVAMPCDVIPGEGVEISGLDSHYSSNAEFIPTGEGMHLVLAKVVDSDGVAAVGSLTLNFVRHHEHNFLEPPKWELPAKTLVVGQNDFPITLRLKPPDMAITVKIAASYGATFSRFSLDGANAWVTEQLKGLTLDVAAPQIVVVNCTLFDSSGPVDMVAQHYVVAFPPPSHAVLRLQPAVSLRGPTSLFDLGFRIRSDEEEVLLAVEGHLHATLGLSHHSLGVNTFQIARHLESHIDKHCILTPLNATPPNATVTVRVGYAFANTWVTFPPPPPAWEGLWTPLKRRTRDQVALSLAVIANYPPRFRCGAFHEPRGRSSGPHRR